MTYDMNPGDLSELNRVLGEAFSAVERERDVVVAPSVRSFVQSLVEESMVVRRSEWLEVTGLDLEDPNQLEEAFGQSAQTVYELLRDAPGEESGDVSLIGTVEAIHNSWCGIYPICRRRPQEMRG